MNLCLWQQFINICGGAGVNEGRLPQWEAEHPCAPFLTAPPEWAGSSHNRQPRSQFMFQQAITIWC